MPRQSVESLAGAAFRASKLRPPAPPPDLSPEAATVWRKIVASRPLPWFDEGSLPILRRLCRSIISAEKLHDAYDGHDPATDRAERLLKQVIALNHSIGNLSVKLRLSVQSDMDWHSGERTKRGLGVERRWRSGVEENHSRLLDGWQKEYDKPDGMVPIPKGLRSGSKMQ